MNVEDSLKNIHWRSKSGGYYLTIPVVWCLRIIPFIQFMGYTLQFSTKNETLTAFYDFPGTQFDETVTTKYTYDADRYPLTYNDGDTQLTFEY